MKEVISAFKTLTGKPTGRIPLGKLRIKWKDNIRLDLKSSIRGIGLIRLMIAIMEEPL